MGKRIPSAASGTSPPCRRFLLAPFPWTRACLLPQEPEKGHRCLEKYLGLVARLEMRLQHETHRGGSM
ncbi:hypothetical protein scyTo_0013960 [Scyliorhinus torazame]|uniref:Uncharacterized protein n=1 Tax=Scyliorhinus torazame TaxID=75743 RepID=A0A401P8E2_SCYTO|nr:hypothetical protein [Scyliorhinus torazame]